MRYRIHRPLSALLLAFALPGPAAAQDVLDRPPNLEGAWVGIPWTLHASLPHRFRDANPGDAIDLAATTSFRFLLGLPGDAAAGATWVLASPTVPDEPDEIEGFLRWSPLDDATAPADLAFTAAWNAAAGSADAEALVARRFGPVRLLGAVRWLSDFRAAGEGTGVAAAGVVWNPLPRSAPLALAADLATAFDRPQGEDLAWSAGVQVGVPLTALTASLHATNAAAATLQGRSFAAGGTRWGFELDLPVPVGFFFGRYPPRREAAAAVREAPGEAADAVVVIRRYAYGPVRVEVPAGGVVEWVNGDAMVHTATAEDGAWDSGAIRPGERWRARFDRPGTYPYYCGPHPFMKGVVIVR